MRFRLRDYKREDFYTLWEIDQSCFAPKIAYTQFELKTYILREDSFTLVVECSDVPQAAITEVRHLRSETTTPHIAGFLVAECGRNHGHIITIDVRREARKHGIGSALLGAAEERLQLNHCPQVRLETAVDNATALSFYKRRGYSITRVVPRYYSNGVDALVLEKDLLSTAASVNVRK